ncbi:MAG: hypothetical protein R3246_17325, partial [Acidimicrobiia bacterium]|nr:hypothetical protein [Acidimicrobiia bacterium]
LRWRGPVGLCIGCATACAPADDAVSVTRTDSAGVEIIVSAGEDRPLDWTFTPRLTLGGTDSGPESFYDLSAQSVATDGVGRLYVLDPSAFRIVAFDSEGAHVWSAGAEGEGPGELIAPIAVTASDDGLVSVVDARAMKIEHFDSAGRYIGGERLSSPPWMSQFGRSGAELIVDERPVLLSDEPRERLLAVSEGDTAELATVELEPQQRMEFDGCPVMVAMPPIFGAELWWAASQNRIAVATGPEYAVSLFESGRLTRSYRREIRPTPATPELAAAEIPNGLSLGAGPVRCDIPPEEAVEKRGFGPFVPLMRGLAIAPDGTVWVQRTRTQENRAAFDLFAADGAY